MTSLAKYADSGNDTSFEEAFSNLAHSIVADKVKGLTPYELGFQVVDKNEDSTRALGVLGYRIGNDLAYVPVLFDNGDIKGHELMFLKSQDLFVPNDENWLQYLEHRKPDTLGKGVTRGPGRLGQSMPSLYQIKHPPSKFAGVKLASWAGEFLPAFARWVARDPFADRKIPGADLLSFLEKAGSAAGMAFARLVARYPGLMEGVDRFHGRDKVAQALRRGREAEELRHSILGRPSRPILPPSLAPKSAAVQVMFASRLMNGHALLGRPGSTEMTDGEKEEVLRGKVVIKDERDDSETTKAYVVSGTQRLFNPTESGLYEVMVAPGEFTRCLVTHAPHSHKGSETFATVVRLDDKAWVNTHPSQVWAKSQETREEFRKWLDGLESAEELDADLSGGPCLILGPEGQATLPFRAIKSHGGEFKTFEVSFHTGAERYRADAAALLQQHAPGRERDVLRDQPLRKPAQLVLTGRRGRKLRAGGDALYVPDDYKYLELHSGNCPCGTDSAPAPVLTLGKLPDFETNLVVKAAAAGLTELKVAFDGRSGSVSGSQALPREELLADLVECHGLRATTALEVMERAASAPAKQASVWVKYAAPYPYTHRDGPNAPVPPDPYTGPDPMGGLTDAIYPQQLKVPAIDAWPDFSERERYLWTLTDGQMPHGRGSPGDDGEEADTAERAMRAARQGDKEVFDTSTIAQVIRSGRVDPMIRQDYLGSAMSHMDQTARLYLNALWNKDKWQDRFGDSEYRDLTEMLLDNFEQEGKVVLRLHEQQPEDFMGAGVLPDLDKERGGNTSR